MTDPPALAILTTPWLPWITLGRRIRALLAERMERGSDKLDRLLAMLIAELDAVERAGWFS